MFRTGCAKFIGMLHLKANCLLTACALLLCWRSASAATHPPLTTTRGAVASDNAIASRVGVEVLEKGGTAVDAAVATALALGVVSPASSGLGGGGFAVIYVAKDKRSYAIDFREVGPAAIHEALFHPQGVLDASLSRVGGLAVAVPGELAGLESLWTKHGKLPWRALVEPARRLAAKGFAVSWFLASAASAVSERLGPAHVMTRWLAPQGRLITAGRLVRRSALAHTLRLIGLHGRDGFYQGRVARDLVDTVHMAGGVLSMRDLEDYQPVWREPLKAQFRDYQIVTMPLPSSGGVLLLEMLGILDAGHFDLVAMGRGSSLSLHIIGEILKHGFADRSRLLGDDRAAEELMSSFLAPSRLRSLAKRISETRVQAHEAYGSAELGPAGASLDDKGTSHLCVVDAEGNAVALTTTVNGYLGSALVGPKSGVVLNNQIDDFALEANAPNMYGLIQSKRNLVGPGKRPLSSMSPTLVLDDTGVIGCFGGSGGPRIISGTFQVILDTLVFGENVEAAVSAPRIHHQWLPNTLYLEEEISPDVVKALQARGHTVDVSASGNAEQAIIRRDGIWQAASDPRKGGVPAAQKAHAP